MPLFEATLERERAARGRDQLETLKSLNNLAMAYKMTGRLDRAVPLLREALELRTAKLGPDNPDTAASMGYLASALILTERPADALPYFGPFLESMRKRFGAETPAFARVLAAVCEDLLKARQDAFAERYLRECLAIREKAEPDTWAMFHARSMLGGALLGQGKTDEAERLLRSGYEGMKRTAKTIVPETRARHIRALDRLIALAEATGHPDEAKTWREERAGLEAAPTPAAEAK
jgi:non-specific serine/threonine protein kinase/serine/threonine-protein kinase